jgi:hypothetical protein
LRLKRCKGFIFICNFACLIQAHADEQIMGEANAVCMLKIIADHILIRGFQVAVAAFGLVRVVIYD